MIHLNTVNLKFVLSLQDTRAHVLVSIQVPAFRVNLMCEVSVAATMDEVRCNATVRRGAGGVTLGVAWGDDIDDDVIPVAGEHTTARDTRHFGFLNPVFSRTQW